MKRPVPKHVEVALRLGAGVLCARCKGTGRRKEVGLPAGVDPCQQCQGIGRRPLPRNARTHTTRDNQRTYCGQWTSAALLADPGTPATCRTCALYGIAP